MNPFFKWSGLGLTALGALALALLLTGCLGPDIEHNVSAPPSPLPKGASAASGFLYKERDAKGVVQAVWLNGDGAQFYAVLLGKFGADLKPPRDPGFGVTTQPVTAAASYPDGNSVKPGDTLYRLNHEAALDFFEMVEWDRSGEHPPKTLWQKAGITP